LVVELLEQFAWIDRMPAVVSTWNEYLYESRGMLEVATSFSRVSKVELPSPAMTRRPRSSAVFSAAVSKTSAGYFVFSSTGA
jgi:hypothetical protein